MPAFTARAVELLKPDPGKRLELPDGALPGFYLVVQPSGSKSWAIRYRADGKTRKFTLGPYPRLGLADARERARTALQTAPTGNSAQAGVRRIRKAAEAGDAAAVAALARVEAGEQSVHAAMVGLGWRQRTLTIPDEPAAIVREPPARSQP